jgi:CHAT domain-containing protein
LLTALCLAVVVAAQPVPPPDAPDPAQRQELERRAQLLSQEAVRRHAQRQLQEATALLEQALAIRRRLYPPATHPGGHLALAESLTNLGLIYHHQGSNSRAEPLLREVLAMNRRLFPKERFPAGHPDLAFSLNNLGGVLTLQGRYAEAEPLAEEALAMRRRLLPPERFPDGHADLVQAMSNLGQLLQRQSKYPRAEALLREAVAMNERLYPKERFPEGHPELGNSLANLAALHAEQGQYGPAETLYTRTLQMRRRLYPPERYPAGHPELAQSLGGMGVVHKEQGHYDKAEPFFRDALAMNRRLYPPERYPAGHSELYVSLWNLAMVRDGQGHYAAAEPLYRAGLDMARQLYAPERFPKGHPQLAQALSGLGGNLQSQAEFAQAEPLLREALAMRRKLYPATRYPAGHPDLATSLLALGRLLQLQGDYGPAEPLCSEALTQARRLFPEERYPAGHPLLASAVGQMGSLLRAQGEDARAEPFDREALALWRKLYPPEGYPQGHPAVGSAQVNLAAVLEQLGKNDQAETLLRDSLAMCRRLYPAQRYPQGHPELANVLDGLAVALEAREAHAEAEKHHREALAMCRRLYAPERYPLGHPRLLRTLANLGLNLLEQGRPAEAEPLFRELLAGQEQQLRHVAEAFAEAQALNFAASQLPARDLYLSASRDQGGAAVCDRLWQGKAVVTRVLEQRQLALRTAADPDLSPRWRELLQTRRRLAGLLLRPEPAAGQARDVAELTERKEALERELAGRLPELARRQAAAASLPADLAARLPAGSAFIDLLAYWQFTVETGPSGRKLRRLTRRYLAFVLGPGRQAVRIELGPAEPIDKGLARWRADLTAGRDGEAAGELRRLLWEPLARRLPAETTTVYLAPDGPLAQLPWAALPGQRAGTVLLEAHAPAVVPHGVFLLERLKEGPRPPRPDDLLLAVGAVAYGQRDAGGKAAPQGAVPGQPRLSWPPLPGTAAELDKVLALAGPRPKLDHRGAAAAVEQVLADLPRARWAHLATHGLFADARFRSILQTDEKAFERGQRGERRGHGARSPLVLSALVLAGANLPHGQNSDGGILTAEAIAGLDLGRLDLAVLSACESGLGDEGGGEGVFGLQRAFHLAGARNVVASLWQVDDEATAALMGLFYHHLWVEKRPPLEALRQAQLALYHHPERIGQLARLRGPDFEKAARLPAASGAASARRSPARLWAGFVLSGAGR